MLLTADGCGRLLLTADGCGRLLLTADGCGRLLLTADGCGRLLLTADGCGRLLLTADGCGLPDFSTVVKGKPPSCLIRPFCTCGHFTGTITFGSPSGERTVTKNDI